MYQSTLLSNIKGLRHGFSTRADGDMKIEPSRRKFAESLGADEPIVGEQVHSSTVVVANGALNIPGADGIVTKDNFALGVLTADCLALLLVDPKARVVGVIHAGWRGTLAKIVKNTVLKMQTLGATPKNMRAVLGPHIGMCCYDVPNDRAQLFTSEFRDDRVVHSADGSWHVDIGFANYLELLELGLEPQHIDAPIFCTSCQHDKFFSYRKDGVSSGRMVGMIAYG